MTKAKKQTSDRVSRIAARVMRKIRELPGWKYVGAHNITTRDVRALAASCLSQDETKGQRKPAKRRAAK